MNVKELITTLGFSVDGSGIARYNSALNGIAARANAVSAEVSSKMSGVFTGLRGLMAGLGGALAFETLTSAGDNLTKTMNALNAATSQNAEITQQAFDEIYKSSRDTGVGTDAMARSFQRFYPAMQKLNYSAVDTVQLLDGINKGMLAGGQTTAETSEVIRQLGQAITSTTFQGDELRTFMEGASATMISRFADALGTTTDKLKKMGSEGHLTVTNVLPALMEAAKAGRDEFGQMEVTTGLALARTRIAVVRFLGELNKTLGINRAIVASMDAVGRRFDAFRDVLPAIGRFVDALGGGRQIMEVVAIAAAGVTAALVAMKWAAIQAFLPWVAGATAVITAAAALHDFYHWVKGTPGLETQFGEWFGPFEELQKELGGFKPFEFFSEQDQRFAENIASLTNSLRDALKGLSGDFNTLKEAWQAFVKDLTGLIDILGTKFDWLVEKAGTALRALGRFFRGDTPSDAGQNYGDDEEARFLERRQRDRNNRQGSNAPAPGDDQFRQNMRDMLDLNNATSIAQELQDIMRLGSGGGYYSQSLAGIRSGAMGINAPQTNNITNQITVNATGVSAAEVASGASSGVNEAMGRTGEALRGAQTAMPAVESRTQ